MIRLLARLVRDARGVAALEYALVLPTMFMLFMGISEVAYQAYVQAVLSGAVQKAGRDSTLKGATTASIDNDVLAQVQSVAPSAVYAAGAPTRASYTSFSNINQSEPFTDTNGNGVRDPGECFTDVNGNGQWDAYAGRSGVGGASDAVVYTATITFPRLFPITSWIGMGPTGTLSATTILKNQPWATQNVPATICN